MRCLETLSVPQLTRQQAQEAEARRVSAWEPGRGQLAGDDDGWSERGAAAMRIWLSILTIVALVLMSCVLPR